MLVFFCLTLTEQTIEHEHPNETGFSCSCLLVMKINMFASFERMVNDTRKLTKITELIFITSNVKNYVTGL